MWKRVSIPVKVETSLIASVLIFILTTNQPVTNHDFETESDKGGPTASDCIDIRKNRVHMLKTNRQNHGSGIKH